MSELSHVWIDSLVLGKALGCEAPKAKPKSDLDRNVPDWNFTRCFLLSGDLSAISTETPLHVKIDDLASEWNEKSATLTEATTAIYIDNAWETPPDDLITLTHLNEPSVVSALKKRYEEDLIYTSTGPILIALNPFKPLPGLYEDDQMSVYWAFGEGIDTNVLPPHVYGHADKAFRAMMQGIEAKMNTSDEESKIALTCDQSMLVSGESGAGKTVSTKHIMKYLASLSQRKAEHLKRRRAPSPGRGEDSAPRRNQSMRQMSRAQSWKAGAQIEEKILESNPVLEAFGNARTIRNDNSSRFGKFIELQFKQSGSLIGASIDTYLLEKVRLIHQKIGERNFHIFYEMLAAVTDEERKEFLLNDYTAQDFKLINTSGTFDRRDGANDAQLFDQLVVSMGTMGFDAKSQENIFGVTMSFLHASNLTFVAITDDSSKVDESNPHLQPVLKLLGLELSDFQDALCQFEIEAGNTSYTRTVNKDYAAKGLEALIKATYGAMFNFIVQSMNKKIDFKAHRNASLGEGKAAFIGVLDIFGFESFKTNSFEQLCINYCNEALQQQFNLYIFKSEQEEYKREGIAWDFIEFPDNQDVIDLIDKTHSGIISILTDQCRTARGSDKLFADAMYKGCEAHKRFEASPLQKGSLKFVINHFAGPVVYETEGFVEKNKDEIPRGATTLLESSSNEFVQLLGKISGPSTAGSGGGRSKNLRPTVGGQFALQLTELRNRIAQTSPHYIRCLKPNQSLAPNEFDEAIIADQLRCAGVLEAIRVSRVGYSQRYTHDAFVQRYCFIALDQVRSAENSETAATLLTTEIAKKIFIAEHPNVPLPTSFKNVEEIQKGQTKIFLRNNSFMYMERFRAEQLRVSAVKFQALARRFLCRCRYLRKRERIIMVQSGCRRFLASKYLRELRQIKAATKIQSRFRCYPIRASFVEKKFVAVWCQRMARGRSGRAKFAALHKAHMDDVAKQAAEYKAAVCIQCMKRSRDARVTKNSLLAEKKIKDASFFGEQSETVKILRAQQVTFALQADKAAAVAKETKQEANKEVVELQKELEKARLSADREKAAREEVISLRAQLDAVLADLDVSRAEETKAKSRVLDLQEENKKLKEQVKTGAFVEGTPYTSSQYDDYDDLKQLDQRMFGNLSRSKQSKKDLEALVQSLAIIR